MTHRQAMRILLRHVHGRPVPPQQVYRAVTAVLATYDRERRP